MNNQKTLSAIAFAGLLTLSAIPSWAAQNQEQQNSSASEEKDDKKEDKTLDTAGDIASQPARDIGVAKTKIPPVLTEAVKNPYAAPSGRKCSAIIADMAVLNEALGPDFSANEEENENKVGKIAEAGGRAVVNSLIPFRGLVREVTGAAPAERRLQAAVGAGLARRGYLRGMATTRGCKIPG